MMREELKFTNEAIITPKDNNDELTNPNHEQ
jgi:hypothetical protein